MDTNELFQLVSEVREDLALPDAETHLAPHARFPTAALVYGEGDPIPDLPWDDTHPNGIRLYRVIEYGAQITIQAPPESLWKGRDVTAAPSPNEPAKTYTYPEGDAA